MSGIAGLRFGVRRVWKHPAHSVLAVLTLALGIGLVTAMFAIVEGTFLRGLPFADGDRLYRVALSDPAKGAEVPAVRAEEFLRWGQAQTSFDGFAAWYGVALKISSAGQLAESRNAGWVTSNLFALTGVRPARGRDFRPEDETPGALSVVVLSDPLWHQRFGADPHVLGRIVRVAGLPSTVIGVMPPGFRFPLNQFFWQPLRMDAAEKHGYSLQVVGRLKEGVAVERARTEIQALARTGEGRQRVTAVVEPYLEGYVDRELRSRQLAMLAAGFGLLLIACVNVANLLLARGAERTPEMAVRTALGAGRWQVISQLLAETLILSALGGSAGLGLARGAIAVYRRWLGDDLPSFWVDVRLDARVFLFTFVLTLLAALIAGLIPALQAASTPPGEILKDQSRGATNLRLGRFARALCVVEIALACGLLVPTGLTLKSLANLGAIPLSFPAGQVLTARLTFYGSDYAEDHARLRRYYSDLASRLSGLAGVRTAAFASRLPLEHPATAYLEIEGKGYARPEDRPEAQWAAVTPGYFDVFGLRVLEGRALTDSDGPEGSPVAVINRSFAELLLPGESPLGRRIRSGGPDRPWRTIVGVVPDLTMGGLENEAPAPAFYLPLAQAPSGGALALRTTRAVPARLIAEIRRAGAAVDPEVPLWGVGTMQEYIGVLAGPYTRAGAVFGVFGGAALFLAVLGIYGVMAFAVSRRTREIGLRMAVGARRADVLRLVLRAGLVQLAVGVVLGLSFAAAGARLLEANLFHVRPWDPGVFVLAPAVLVAAGLAACLIPARRAARVDPMESLRYE